MLCFTFLCVFVYRNLAFDLASRVLLMLGTWMMQKNYSQQEKRYTVDNMFTIRWPRLCSNLAFLSHTCNQMLEKTPILDTKAQQVGVNIYKGTLRL